MDDVVVVAATAATGGGGGDAADGAPPIAIDAEADRTTVTRGDNNIMMRDNNIKSLPCVAGVRWPMQGDKIIYAPLNA